MNKTMDDEIKNKIMKELKESRDKEQYISSLFMGLFGFMMGVACTLGFFSREIFG